MFVISFVTFKKVYFMFFFLVKIAIDPKTDYESKTDFPFYLSKFIFSLKHSIRLSMNLDNHRS